MWARLLRSLQGGGSAPLLDAALGEDVPTPRPSAPVAAPSGSSVSSGAAPRAMLALTVPKAKKVPRDFEDLMVLQGYVDRLVIQVRASKVRWD